MNKPRLEAVYFGGREYSRLASVLEISAKHHLGDRWDINVKKIPGHNLKAALSSKYVRKGLFPNNAHKALAWCEIVEKSKDGDRLLLIDCDTFIRGNIDEIWKLDFDYARTIRDYKWPWNSGVMFLRVNERTKKFFRLITEETFKMLNDAVYHEKYEEKFGGIHQASTSAVIERNEVPGMNIVDIPCRIWNSEHTSRDYEDFKQAKIVHLLPSGRKKVIKSKSWVKDKRWKYIGREWHNWDSQVPKIYRWDEIVNRLKNFNRNDLIIAEVGVWEGDLTRKLLNCGLIKEYHLIDPWKSAEPGSTWYNSGSKLSGYNQGRLDIAYRTLVKRVKKFKNIVTIHKMDSIDVTESFEDKKFDLVFIDANHHYEAVLADIQAWLPKVKDDGYIGGHDLDEPRFPGVRLAIEKVFGPNFEWGDDYTWFVKLSEREKVNF